MTVEFVQLSVYRQFGLLFVAFLGFEWSPVEAATVAVIVEFADVTARAAAVVVVAGLAVAAGFVAAAVDLLPVAAGAVDLIAVAAAAAKLLIYNYISAFILIF